MKFTLTLVAAFSATAMAAPQFGFPSFGFPGFGNAAEPAAESPCVKECHTKCEGESFFQKAFCESKCKSDVSVSYPHREHS